MGCTFTPAGLKGWSKYPKNILANLSKLHIPTSDCFFSVLTGIQIPKTGGYFKVIQRLFFLFPNENYEPSLELSQ